MNVQVRPDIQQQYASLFGPKSVNGRTVVVEGLIAQMAINTARELPQLLAERHAFRERVARGEAR